MKRFAIIAALLASGCAPEAEAPATLAIGEAWARESAPGAAVSAGYLTLAGGDAGDRLIRAESDIADRTEIHSMTMTDGVMRMRPLPDGIAIGPGETIRLAPGGDHIMFVDLRRPLAAGESIAVTLHFERAGARAVPFAVRPAGHVPHHGGE